MTKLTILLIDDNPDDREHYSDLLKRCSPSYNVLVAESGQEAIQIFKTEQIDCTIIDYNLPEMDGLEILETLQKTTTQCLATIVLTGEPHQSIQVGAARGGALDYIIKDVHTTPEQLQAIIAKTIQWTSQVNAKQTT